MQKSTIILIHFRSLGLSRIKFKTILKFLPSSLSHDHIEVCLQNIIHIQIMKQFFCYFPFNFWNKNVDGKKMQNGFLISFYASLETKFCLSISIMAS